MQELIDVAVSFYNAREMNLAREAAGEALLAAEPIISGRSPAPALRRADLWSSLGVLHESVLFDLPRAETFYETARTLNPADQINSRRKKAAEEKQKLRAGGGR